MTNELIGRRFGAIVVVGDARLINKNRYVTIRCDCGNLKEMRARLVELGRRASCGCALGDELRAAKQRTHGHTKKMGGKVVLTPEYRTWQRMVAKCTNPKNAAFRRYGGAGIHVCERWLKFENFLADMGFRPIDKESIDRIDGRNGYEPGNCRWATRVEQNRNTTQNVLVTIDGVALCASEWAQRNAMSPSTVLSRIRNGWDPKAAVTCPVGGKRNAA